VPEFVEPMVGPVALDQLVAKLFEELAKYSVWRRPDQQDYTEHGCQPFKSSLNP
jgi:hypothetical protein